MESSFTPSVNIVRDREKKLTYLPTGNSRRVYEQIATGFRTGTRSFNIIGSYGTGKSAFLWAIERQLSNRATYFGPINGHFNGVRRFETLNIIGEYDSIVNSFARGIGLNARRVNEQLILKKLASEHEKAAKKKSGLLIVIDELGKFLEYAASKEGERELYFIQQLAEFCNDSSMRFLLLTSLHQGFDSYARRLDQVQRHEWEKVKGRLTELPFNEQVDQLLYLAGEYLHTETIERGPTSSLETISSFTQKICSYNFDVNKISEIAKKLLPLEPIAASVLTLALQACGQNERSLFTFLSSHDYLGVRAFDRRSNPLYNLSCVYDYLIGNHYSFIASRDNPRYVQWAAIQRAIERVEGSIDTDTHNALKLVKAIGLLNIFGLESTRLDSDVLVEYGRTAMGIDDPLRVVKALEDKKILRFIHFKNRYVLFEGTDFDFSAAFASASSKVDPISDVVPKLQSFFTFPVIRCKTATMKRGTPRFFEYQISHKPITALSAGEIDGIVNLIFSAPQNVGEVKTVSKGVHEAIVYCVFDNIVSIQNTLWDIDKSSAVLASVTDDLVARREVKAILDYQIQELNRLVLNSMFADSVTWIFRGKEIPIHSQHDLNKYLSLAIERIYDETPTFHNELINRHHLPPAVVTARRNLIEKLIANWDREDIGFPKDKFPAEKTIYLTLLQNTGIHKKRRDGWSLGKPSDKTFHPLWSRCEAFMAGTKSTRKSIADLFEIVLSRPLKLKKGLAEIWVPIFLIIKREDYALFGEQGYIPYLTRDIFNLILKNPDKFWVKAFNIAGVRLNLLNRYRRLLNKQPTERISTSNFIDTIRPFLTFFRGLPEYAKSTKRLTPTALALRDAIVSARDPEKTFFEDMPSALGYDVQILQKDDKRLHEYVQKLQDSIREIRTSFDDLLNRVEASLLRHLGYDSLGFLEYRQELRERFHSLREYLLLPHQKTFFQRLTSEIDDRRAWLGSITQCVLGKPIELVRDEEEDLLQTKLLIEIHELDNLCEITEAGVNIESEDVVRFELASLSKGTQKKLLRIPKSKTLAADDLSAKIRAQFSSDKDVNVAALLKLLGELNSNE